MNNSIEKTTKQTGKIHLALLITLLLIFLGGTITARQADRGFGDVDVTTVSFLSEQNVPITAKIYRPKNVTADNPAPGLLALHGYQSDKEATTTFGTIELARRGFVVLSIDQFGHGYSTQHPVDPKIMSGAQNGLNYLKSLNFVKSDKLGTYGHSTGSIYALKLAAANPEVQAVVALSGNGGDKDIHKVRNYLLVQGDAEEIGGYREKTFPVKDLNTHPNRLAAFGLEKNETLQWNHTYGNFADGSARRAELVRGTHLGVMTSPASNTAVVEWFTQAFQSDIPTPSIDPDSHIYQWKEIGGGIALFALLGTLVPLTALLVRLPLFRQALGSEGTLQGSSRKGRLGLAAANIVLSLFLYPYFTQHGGGKDPISAKIPFLPLQMGNGITVWLLVSTIIAAISFLIWFKVGGGKKLSASDIGLLQPQGSARWIGFGFLLSATLIAWLALAVSTVYFFSGPEIRILWPMLKTLTPERVLILLPYFLVIWAFFFIVNGLNINTMARIGNADAGYTRRLWAKRALFAIVTNVAGLLILFLFHFIPALWGPGPGMDIIGLPQYGGRWMMMLFVIIPQFTVLTMINTWFQTRTRSIWVASLVGASIFTWMMVGGQVGVF